MLCPPGLLPVPKDGRLLTATSLELYFCVCVCVCSFLYAYFKMVHGGERRRKKGGHIFFNRTTKLKIHGFTQTKDALAVVSMSAGMYQATSMVSA